MIGDRILADTVMGNSFGFFTIDTLPFNTEKENIMVKLSRIIERKILPAIIP